MNSRKYKFPIISLLLILTAVVSSCSGNKKSDTAADSFPEEVRDVAIAIITESPEKFAGAMSYPITRPYPLREVKDSSEMVKYYPKIVDDKLKKAVKEAPDSAWSQDGWRGWTLNDGQFFWIDGGKIYAINYVSDEENVMLDSLRMMEIASLSPELRGNWVPVMCVVDSIDGVIFRIDSEKQMSEKPKMRLAGYPYRTNLSQRPKLLLYGSLEEEGTMENRFYQFSDSIGNYAEYAPDAVDDSIPILEVRRKGKKARKYRVTPGYWLDYVTPTPVDSILEITHADSHQAQGKTLAVPASKRAKRDSAKMSPVKPVTPPADSVR